MMNPFRAAAISTFIAIFLFFCHKRAQYIYHERCTFDIIQVLFFKNSRFCTFLHHFITFIEDYYLGIFDLLIKSINPAYKNF